MYIVSMRHVSPRHPLNQELEISNSQTRRKSRVKRRHTSSVASPSQLQKHNSGITTTLNFNFNFNFNHDLSTKEVGQKRRTSISTR